MPSGVSYPDLKPPTSTTVDLSAEIKKIYGPEWNKPEISYEINGRKFYLKTGDSYL